MEWTSQWIRVWFFPRSQVPASILNGQPDPSSFGLPQANFEGECNFDGHFANHSIIFDTTFCGNLAGPMYASQNCPMTNPNGWTSCDDFVADNPSAFVNAYWQVNNLTVYQSPQSALPPSSSVTSVAPAAGTSPAGTLPAGGQGQTSTPSFSLLVTSSPTATNPLPPRAPYTSGELPDDCRAWPAGPLPAPLPAPSCMSRHLPFPQYEYDPATPVDDVKRGADAQGVPGGTTGTCSVPGMTCLKDSIVADHDNHEAQPDATTDGVPGGAVESCSVPGAACQKNSTVDDHDNHEAQPDATTDGVPGGTVQTCSVPGAACEKNSTVGDYDKHEAQPEATAGVPGGVVEPCSVPGDSCGHHRKLMSTRDSNAQDFVESAGVDGGVITDCSVPGMACDEHDFTRGGSENKVGQDQVYNTSILTSAASMQLPREEFGLATTTPLISPAGTRGTDTSAHYTATCTPAVVVGPKGTVQDGGCILPAGISVTLSEPVVRASTTATVSTVQGSPKLYNGELNRVLGQDSDSSDTSTGSHVAESLILLPLASFLMAVLLL
jgi:hypothetical protein